MYVKLKSEEIQKVVQAEVPDEPFYFFFLCLGILLAYAIPKFNGLYYRLADIFQAILPS